MDVEISVQSVMLPGCLEIPSGAKNLVIVCTDKEFLGAEQMNELGIATLVVVMQESSDLTERLIGVTRWCVENEDLKDMKTAYLGIGLGAQAALSASAYWGTKIKAMVVVGGRPDLALEVLDLIESPALLITGSEEAKEIALFRTAYQKIGSVKKLELVTDETKISQLTGQWFVKHLV